MPRETETLDTPTIGRAAWEALQRHHRGRSVDELLVHPSEAIEICKSVRATLSRRLSDPEILRALINARKRGLLK